MNVNQKRLVWIHDHVRRQTENEGDGNQSSRGRKLICDMNRSRKGFREEE